MNRQAKGGEDLATADRRATTWSGCFSEVFHIRGQTGVHRIRSAKPLKPGRYFRVVQVGMIAAAGADELERVVMAGFYPAVHDAGRLAPKACRGAVTRLAQKRRHLGILVINAQPGITNVLLAARWGNCIQGLRRPNACCGARVWNAHSTFLPGLVAWLSPLPGSGAALRALNLQINLQEEIRASHVHYAGHRAPARCPLRESGAPRGGLSRLLASLVVYLCVGSVLLHRLSTNLPAIFPPRQAGTRHSRKFRSSYVAGAGGSVSAAMHVVSRRRI